MGTSFFVQWDGFSKIVLGFVKMSLSSMPYLSSAHVIPKGIKSNYAHKGNLDENLDENFLPYFKV